MINLNDPKYIQLTKEELLLKYSDYDIFKYYVGDFELGQVYNSPLRRGDDIPSFNIFYSSQHNCLLFKDFAGKRGDVIIFVQELFSLLTYQDAINRIDQDMDKLLYLLPSPLKAVYSSYSKIECQIQIVARSWYKRDIDYWDKFGITLPTLQRFYVVPIFGYYHNQFYIETTDLAYAYLEYKDQKLTYKIYRPLASKNKKWRNNNPYGVHAGYTQLPKKGRLLIITKSLKDVMSLYECLFIPSIAVQSETCFIKDTVVEEYKTRFNQIVTLFDNDRQGIEQGESYQKLYNIPSIFIPDKHRVKDFSDLVKQVGKVHAGDILKELILTN